MKLLDYLDRVGQRRLERHRLSPPRPVDLRMFVGVLFFIGYYALIYFLMRNRIPMDNSKLVGDAMLVLGPVVGMIAQALFRTDVKDEIATQNTGEAFRASRAQAEATKAAAETTPAVPDPKALRDGDKIELNKEDAQVGLNREVEP